MTIKAIETAYAGCRFRSRLEARWAVFFDTLGIKWQYEVQGYQLEDRLYVRNTTDPINYLPDFWLPEFNLHAEVKGSFSVQDFARTLTAAAALSAPKGGCGGGNDLVIFGPIPEPERRSRHPMRLHMHKGDLVATAFWASQLQPLGDKCPLFNGSSYGIADDTGNIEVTPRMLLGGIPGKVGDQWADGYRAARSARFEHGECG